MKTNHLSVGRHAFHEILEVRERSPDIPAEHDIYGWLIGSWNLDVTFFAEAGHRIETTGEAHFVRVLEGRAVQDLFINPRRADRGADMPEYPGNWFGTTLRIFDASQRTWRVHWFNPRDGFRCELVGRRVGDDIVQQGAFPDGTPIKWKFTEIAKDGFRWLAERQAPGANHWQRQVEMCGTRVV